MLKLVFLAIVMWGLAGCILVPVGHHDGHGGSRGGHDHRHH